MVKSMKSRNNERKFQIEMLKIRLSSSRANTWATVFMAMGFSLWVSSNTTIGLAGLWDFGTFLLFNFSAVLLMFSIVSVYSLYLRNLKNGIAKLEKEFTES